MGFTGTRRSVGCQGAYHLSLGGETIWYFDCYGDEYGRGWVLALWPERGDGESPGNVERAYCISWLCQYH